jgi:hypothetical protein
MITAFGMGAAEAAAQVHGFDGLLLCMIKI